VHSKYKAKTMMAASLGSLLLAVVLLVLVIPATNPGRVTTEAQPGFTPRMPGTGMPPGAARVPSGRPGAQMPGGPGMGMPGQMGMIGVGMGMEAAPAVNVFEGAPLESSRPNPFLSEVGAVPRVGTTYGPNWQQMPLASRINIGPADRAPEPEPVAAPEAGEQKFMRISSILWTAGKPLAIFEMGTGQTGSVQLGDIIDDWLVEQIGQDYVMIRNVVSGERRRVPLKGK